MSLSMCLYSAWSANTTHLHEDVSHASRVTRHVSRVTWEQSPVVCGRLDVDPVPVEAAVAVGGEGAAGPHAHRVHVVPGEAEHNMCEH